jgi:mannitol operon repressor
MPWVESPNEATLKQHPNLKEFLPFLDTSNAESPRGRVLVACSFLEGQLKEIIESYFVLGSDKKLLLEGFNAPLGTFSARIKTAHCLGLISDFERDDCETLRRIRNEFAHNYKTSFEDHKIADLCKNLHSSAKNYGDIALDTYGQFSTGSVGLVLKLVNRAHYVGAVRLEMKEWAT